MNEAELKAELARIEKEKKVKSDNEQKESLERILQDNTHYIEYHTDYSSKPFTLWKPLKLKYNDMWFMEFVTVYLKQQTGFYWDIRLTTNIHSNSYSELNKLKSITEKEYNQEIQKIKTLITENLGTDNFKQ